MKRCLLAIVIFLLGGAVSVFQPQARNGGDQFKQFFEAVKGGDVGRVRELLDSGIDVNAPRDNHTALHWAALHKQPEVVQELIRAGADVHATHHLDGTALHMSAARGPVQSVKALLEAGADVHRSSIRNGTPLHAAAHGGDVEIVRVLLDAGAKVDDRWRGHRMTPLARAAKYGHAGVAEVLLKAGADPNDRDSPALPWARSPETAKVLMAGGADVNGRDDHGQTALHLPIGRYWGPRIEVVEMLIAAGADVNARDEEQGTPLQAAARLRYPRVARALLRAGADVNARDRFGNTPLSLAQEGENEELVILLTEAGATDALSPLTRAAAQGDSDVVRKLLAEGADVNEIGPRGRTPLHMASAGGHALIVVELIAAGSDVKAATQEGVTALHLAANRDVALALLDAGAAIEPHALFAAATEGRPDVVAVLLDRGTGVIPSGMVVWVTFAGRIDVLKLLLDRGAKATDKLSFGESALHVAASGLLADMRSPEEVTPERRMRMAEVLLKAGAKVNAKARIGYFDDDTPLHGAASRGHADMVRLLLEHQADVNAVGAGEYFGRVTPLHLAARRGHLEVAELLLQAGADVNATTGPKSTDPNRTPLDLAKTPDMKALLRRFGREPATELDE